jgi:[ribosomal protein S5]-alanine N-acetyltransferase
MKTVFIAGEKVDLCALEEWALEGNYVQWLNDPEVCQYNSHHVFPYNQEKAREYITRVGGSRSELVLAVCVKGKGTHIGNIALQAIDWVARSAEYAIILGEKEAWGKGYAGEASMLLLRHGFNELGLHRIHCGTSAENTGMQKLAAKLGMKEEGRRREGLFKHGKFIDIIEYGILKSEFKG